LKTKFTGSVMHPGTN